MGSKITWLLLPVHKRRKYHLIYLNTAAQNLNGKMSFKMQPTIASKELAYFQSGCKSGKCRKNRLIASRKYLIAKKKKVDGSIYVD